MKYQAAVDYIFKLNPSKIRYGLDRISSVLSYLSNPEDFFKSIIIAGTNGKGSTAEMIYSILKRSGYKTGIYTSPHIERFEERIRVDVCIPEGRVGEFTGIIISALKETGTELTFFEFITVMAFLYFKEEGVTIAVLETGMGGRLDAVNVCNPVVSVITDIACDHTEWLGSRIEEIAYEKGGIIKDRGKVVSSCRNSNAIAVLERICSERGAGISIIDRDFFVNITEREIGKRSFDFSDKDSCFDNITLPIGGDHFVSNAGGAIEASLELKRLGYHIEKADIYNGIAEVKISCRFEILRTSPYVIADVAHNPHGITALLDTIKQQFVYNRLIFVFGAMKEKKIDEMIDIIYKSADKIFLTRPSSDRAADPDDIIKRNSFLSDRCVVEHDVGKAVLKALDMAGADDIICMSGSFAVSAEGKKAVTGQRPLS